MRARTLLVLVLVIASLSIRRATPAEAQATPTVDVDRVLRVLAPETERMLLEGNIPSAAVALVAGDRRIWSGGFGTANLWARTPATAETVYIIGSTFKAMSALALLQQMERGAFRLDDPVRGHIPELPIGGEDPDDPITFRHLLTHTSGLGEAHGGFPVWGDSVPPPLEQYLPGDRKSVV